MMNYLRKIDTLGTYNPAFFSLFVNTNESLEDLENANPITKATFFHEYIHFLQDIFTIYGLRNISNVVNKVYLLNQEALRAESFIPITRKNNDINLLLNIIFTGTTEINSNVDLIKSITISPNESIERFEQVPYIDVEFLDFKNKSTDNFYLGASVIRESLAYIIEKEIFFDYNAPIFPYRIVEIIISQKYPELSFDNKLIIALCEEALNSGHPGKTLIDILDKIKGLNLSITSPSELHDFCDKNYYLVDENGEKYKNRQYFLDSIKVTSDNLKVYFPDNNIVKISEWIDYTFNQVLKYKIKDFRFYKLLENKDLLFEIFNNIGSPLATNGANFYFFHPTLTPETCDIALFTAISEIIDVLQGNSRSCNLKSFCQTSTKKVLTNNNCDVAPWKNSRQDDLCFFGFIWHTWGIPR